MILLKVSAMMNTHWRPETCLPNALCKLPSIWRNGKWERRAHLSMPSAKVCYLYSRCWAPWLVPRWTLAEYMLFALNQFIIQVLIQYSKRLTSKLLFSEFFCVLWHSPHFHISHVTVMKRLFSALVVMGLMLLSIVIALLPLDSHFVHS